MSVKDSTYLTLHNYCQITENWCLSFQINIPRLILIMLYYDCTYTNRWNYIFCCRHRVSKWYYMQCIWNFLQDYLCMWNMFDKTLLQHINDARVLCAQRWYMMIITLNLLLQYIWMWRNTLLCVGVTHGS